MSERGDLVTKGQKAVCILLCLCMLWILMLRVGMTAAVQKAENSNYGFFAEIIPLLAYCQEKENQKPLIED